MTTPLDNLATQLDLDIKSLSSVCSSDLGVRQAMTSLFEYGRSLGGDQSPADGQKSSGQVCPEPWPSSERYARPEDATPTPDWISRVDDFPPLPASQCNPRA